MCMFSAPPAPAPQKAAAPVDNSAAEEEARKKALLDEQRRKGLGAKPLSMTPLGSDSKGEMKRPTLLGQSASMAA